MTADQWASHIAVRAVRDQSGTITPRSIPEPRHGPDTAADSNPDRILWNRRPTETHNGEIDELVVHGCDVHIEQVNTDCWWIGIHKDGADWSGNFTVETRKKMRFSQQDAGLTWGRDDTHEAP